MESFFQIFDRYGVSLGMLIVFLIGSAYVLRRLFNEKTGLLTNYMKETSQRYERLGSTIETQAETGRRVATVMESSDQTLRDIREASHRLEQMHFDPNSAFSTVTLGKCFVNVCDVAEIMATKLEIDDKCKPHLDIMRRALKDHAAAVRMKTNQGE